MEMLEDLIQNPKGGKANSTSALDSTTTTL